MNRPTIGLKLTGDRAIVTGSGSGIGKAIALLLARAGVSVYALGRRIEPLEALAAEVGAGLITPITADIRDADRINAVLDEIEVAGPVPMLVNAAAGAFLSRAEDISPNGFRSVVDASLTGPFLVLQRWARGRITAGGGGAAVIITSTFAAREEAGFAHSVAAKAGLESLIRSVAVEWGAHDIRVNAVAPGPVATEGANETTWKLPGVRDRVLGDVPLNRFADPEEIAGATAYLLSTIGSYVTGESIAVDGGWRLLGAPFGLPET